ncbi:MAG: ABC transporter substrate-binding protein [Clostridia bacterium]|nr:ABC transporter substrate-binding protein [Clostridia bacterium]
MKKRLLSIALIPALLLGIFSGCSARQSAVKLEALSLQSQMQLSYATQFSVDYYEGGYKLISLADGSRFLTIPESAAVPDDLDSSIVPVKQPLQNIYLAATSAMCLFDALGRLDAIRLSGTKAEGWYIDNARKAMEAGDILYAGKYSEPDYELLLSEKSSLAVESMMIGHAADVKAQLEQLGIPVFIDQSSNETHPLGRAEWIRLYGALLDEEDKAKALFDEQAEKMNEIAGESDTGKSVAFFYISSSGSVITRKSGDYVSKMIELAGGQYIFKSLGDDGKKTSSYTLEMESFYQTAKDADILIYNATIAEELHSLSELLQKNELLKDFKAVKSGNVWCTARSMYQETMVCGDLVQSFHRIFTDTTGELDEVPYLVRLK